MSRIFLFAALAFSATLASAQSGYPRKPILMLVPLQAASAVDNAARIVAQKMADSMGQPIVVENQPGDDRLQPVFGEHERIGSSRAQRDLIEYTLMAALAKAGRHDDAGKLAVRGARKRRIGAA